MKSVALILGTALAILTLGVLVGYELGFQLAAKGCIDNYSKHELWDK